VGDDRVGAVFSALGDPTRRHLLESLTHGRATISGLAAGLPVTRQAVSKHLATLGEAGLVRSERTGREVHFEITPGAMSEPAQWMAEIGAEWDARLARLGELFADRDPRGDAER
jgi:DNA-binding transcriptional ArsR family regulator